MSRKKQEVQARGVFSDHMKEIFGSLDLCHISNNPQWGLIFPENVLHQMTPDNAPDLERRVIQALKLLKGWRPDG